jgi:hypothetical protein
MSLRRQDSDDEDQSGNEDELFTDSDSSVAGDDGELNPLRGLISLIILI